MSLCLRAVTVGPAGGQPLFAPLTMEIAPGAVATVMGPSGVGKSTLLDAIGGHLAHGFAVAGQVTLSGRDVLAFPAEDRRIGVLFQDAMLFPHLSVGDNLAFGLSRGVKGHARRVAVEEALGQAGLSGYAARDPATLSGGQRARAALMRSLLAAPLALLLDEPFSRLDADLRAEIRSFVFDHVLARNIPALMVTHDESDAEATGGAVVRL